MIPRFLTRFVKIPKAIDKIPNRVGPLDVRLAICVGPAMIRNHIDGSRNQMESLDHAM